MILCSAASKTMCGLHCDRRRSAFSRHSTWATWRSKVPMHQNSGGHQRRVNPNTKNKSTPKIAVTHGFPNGTVGFLGGPKLPPHNLFGKPRGKRTSADSHELPHRSSHMLGPVVPILTGYPPKHGWWDKSTIEVGKGRNQKCLD